MIETNLGFGLMRLPCTNGADTSSIDMPLFTCLADRFLADGGHYFDTAYPYHNGKSETAFREAVALRHSRESFTITDKMPVWLVKKTEDYSVLFEEQLKRCGVCHFDYYWLHALNAQRYTQQKELGGFAFLEKLKDEGKILHTGFSFHDKAAVLEQILTEQPQLEYVQLQINYIDWENPAVESRKCYEVAFAHHKPIIVMEPLKGGCLGNIPQKAEEVFQAVHPDWSDAQWALSFVRSLPGIFMVLSGMNEMSQVETNLKDCQLPVTLGNEEQDAIATVRKIINDTIAIPCTGCGYCKEGCPKHINIPSLFSLRNDVARYSLIPGLRRRYGMQGSKPSDCIKCHRCEHACPQHLPITTLLEETAKVFEN